MTDPAMMTAEKPPPGPPSLLRTMVRPRWILALLAALVVAAGFAFLGRWQLGRAVQSDVTVTRATEKVVALSSVAKPDGPIAEDAIGQKVRVTGRFVPDDYRVIGDRTNDGTTGYWVAGHLTVTRSGSSGVPVALAVARGWAPTEKAARAAIRTLSAQPDAPVTITGRLLPGEAPEVPDPHADPATMTSMSVAALYNLWTDVDGTDVYTAYVVQFHPPAGLTAIDAPPPIPPTTINWLNLFYAIEWAVFAGFAVFMWYRLVKDSWKRALEDSAEGSAAGGSQERPGDTS